MSKKLILGFVVICLSIISVSGQEYDSEAGKFDYGKMWTFENPPIDWFKEAHNFDVDQEWFDDVRKSALKFADWCSGSFVSPNGLIMTNHHCSRDVVVDLQKNGENFDDQGFYAPDFESERKAEGLFIRQLIKVKDITERVKDYESKGSTAEEKVKLVAEIQDKIREEYSAKSDWEGLTLEFVSFYSGGKYSLYGYKKYTDIRLVMIPEASLGYFGGDPDNFTYPRYNLDVTFWRAYENGKPVNTSSNYFKFNIDGISEGESVFVVGNPARTERYRTVAQLEFDRDYRYPMQVQWLRDRMAIMQAEHDKNPNQDLMNRILSFSNSAKALGGIHKGLQNDILLGRKKAFEDKIRANSQSKAWDELAGYMKELGPLSANTRLLAPTPLNGNMVMLMHQLHDYMTTMDDKDKDERLTNISDVITLVDAIKANTATEKPYFTSFIDEMKQFGQPGLVSELIGNQSGSQLWDQIMGSDLFTLSKEKLAKYKLKKLMKKGGPLVEMSQKMIPAFQQSVEKFQSTSAVRKQLQEEVANEVFKSEGSTLPPDATFTLRISDGKVASYNYNGTTAPVVTTYYGLYDRHYSNNGEFPWNLPSRWMNPSTELLRSPLNFVSTNDIIGGNSGSAIINKNKEAVGLIFDGNIESLPGNFIFEEKYNRSVSVHAGGIVAALKHIYSADELVNELLGK